MGARYYRLETFVCGGFDGAVMSSALADQQMQRLENDRLRIYEKTSCACSIVDIDGRVRGIRC